MSDPVSAMLLLPAEPAPLPPKLGMTWATATRPGGEYLAGHVVKLVAYREMLRYGTKNQNCGDWKGVAQARKRGAWSWVRSRRRCKQASQLSSRAALDRIRWFCLVPRVKNGARKFLMPFQSQRRLSLPCKTSIDCSEPVTNCVNNLYSVAVLISYLLVDTCYS